MRSSKESWASTPGRARIMKAIRRRDTQPEVAVRRLLHAHGFRYRVDWGLPFDKRRKADIAFPRARVLVFIDGCFWHGCPEHYRAPTTNAPYWARKIQGNLSRDLDTDERLAATGWIVLRFWEHEEPELTVGVIEEAVLRSRQP